MLLTSPIDRTECQMPSPEKLKRKIIIKHKKLPDGHEERVVIRANDEGELILYSFDFLLQYLQNILFLTFPI